MFTLTFTGPFRFNNNTVVANGSMVLTLSAPAIIISTGASAPSSYTFNLDANGNGPSAAQVWGNAELSVNGVPGTTNYTITIWSGANGTGTIVSNASCIVGPSAPYAGTLFPNVTVYPLLSTNTVGGATISGTPSSGQVLMATSGTAADWNWPLPATQTAPAHEWASAMDHSGNLTFTQPAASDLSNGTTGSGSVVLATSPSLITPALGAATATSVNGLGITTTTGTLTVANGKTLKADNTLELAGTDGTKFTFPAATDTVACLGTVQTWTAAQTFNNGDLKLAGSSSGITTLEASATASGTLTLPAATDTLVARATTDTLTNKTLTSPVVNGTPTGTGIPTTTVKTGTGSGNYSSTSTTLVNVDGTNLSYTVTIPIGWKLLIWASCQASGASAAVFYELALADGGAVLAGAVFPQSTTNLPTTLNWAITGDGASHTVTLQYRTNNAADAVTVQNNSSTTTPVMTFFLTPSN